MYYRFIPTTSKKFIIHSLFFLFINLISFPLWAGILDRLEVGGTFRLPGSSLSSILLDKNDDNVVDGIDFDRDGIPELNMINIGKENTVGIDDDFDGFSDFYIAETKSGDLVIINSLTEEIEEVDADSSMKKIYIWNELSFIGIGNYSFTFSDFSTVLPAAFGGGVFIEQGFDSLFSDITGLERHFWFPGLRIAGTYNLLTAEASNSNVSWIGIQAGPLWRIGITSEHNGYFTISTLFGIANLAIQIDRGIIQGFSFGADLVLGYEYRLSNVIFSINVSGKYILSGQDVTFFQVSGFGGVGYNIKL